MSADANERRLPYVAPQAECPCPQCGRPSVAMVIKYDSPGALEECAQGHRWKQVTLA